MTLGQRLKKLRQQKGFTQWRLGARLDLAESTISLYEADKRCPDYHILRQLATLFEVSVDYLLGLPQDPQPHPLLRETVPDYSAVPQLSIYNPRSASNHFAPSDQQHQYQPQSEAQQFWLSIDNTAYTAEGILEGDLVLIDRTAVIAQGDLVLAISAPKSHSEHVFLYRVTSSTPQSPLVIGRLMEVKRTYVPNYPALS